MAVAAVTATVHNFFFLFCLFVWLLWFLCFGLVVCDSFICHICFCVFDSFVRVPVVFVCLCVFILRLFRAQYDLAYDYLCLAIGNPANCHWPQWWWLWWSASSSCSSPLSANRYRFLSLSLFHFSPMHFYLRHFLRLRQMCVGFCWNPLRNEQNQFRHQNRCYSLCFICVMHIRECSVACICTECVRVCACVL